MMASEGEAVMLDVKTIRHDGKPAGMADPREGTGLAMTMMRIAAAIKTSIAPLAVTMTRGKAPAAMTMTHLREEQKEAVVAAKISRRTARANNDVTLRHLHQGAPMAAAVVVADQQGRATLARIRRTRSPMTPVPI
jgi:thymidine phosphorylase